MYFLISHFEIKFCMLTGRWRYRVGKTSNDDSDPDAKEVTPFVDTPRFQHKPNVNISLTSTTACDNALQITQTITQSATLVCMTLDILHVANGDYRKL